MQVEGQIISEGHKFKRTWTHVRKWIPKKKKKENEYQLPKGNEFWWSTTEEDRRHNGIKHLHVYCFFPKWENLIRSQ